jgi:hypothetical protein
MNKILTVAAIAVSSLGFSVALAGDAAASKTCGQMVADSAPMPAKVAELMTAYAEEAEAHAVYQAAQKGDKNAAAEAEGMKKLAQSYRDAAAALAKTAEAMKAAAAWPGAKHDMKAMAADAKLKAAMDKVQAQQKEFGGMVAKMSAPPAAAAPAPAKK